MRKDLVNLLAVPDNIQILVVKSRGKEESTFPLNLLEDRVPDSVYAEMRYGINFVKDEIGKGNLNAVSERGFDEYGKSFNNHVNYRICKKKD